jgi:hypothetical protein
MIWFSFQRSGPMLKVSRASLWLAGSVSLLAASACSTPTINGFNLTAGPANVNIAPGGISYITVAATATGSAAVNVAVVVYGLPAGVSYSPTAPTIATGSQTNIVLTAAPNAPAGTSVTHVSGYAGLAYSNSEISVTVAPNP